MEPNKHELIKDLESGGEENVRNAFDKGQYRGQTEIVVRNWLAQKKAQRLDSVQVEQLDIARSSKDAAWESANAARDAAHEAKKANIIAAVALAVAIIAIAVSVLGVFIG